MRHLERHLGRLRSRFAGMPDPRRGRNRRYPMADVGMAALSVFPMQSPSFLSHQRALAERGRRSNAHTLFGLDRIPCDNHIRQLLDGVPTAHFDEQFHGLAADLDAHGALEPMRRLDGRTPVALDVYGVQLGRMPAVPAAMNSAPARGEDASWRPIRASSGLRGAKTSRMVPPMVGESSGRGCTMTRGSRSKQ